MFFLLYSLVLSNGGIIKILRFKQKADGLHISVIVPLELTPENDLIVYYFIGIFMTIVKWSHIYLYIYIERKV